ncbi:threonine synthase [Paulownia witches'-broom phytoplasma]|uniref:Threonine synthase n=1 Tax=Paulownia witches'-broom phytoplasma TaxID=39647 RepID=A0ABX8TPJ5_9MOLU|nr:threonine synthase [Paulownia witches'-broom phytoplasma]QYC31249.1 threonine synthase [Paulownia witches'-broom phytoplasma]GLH61000.1 hypothetical protein PAWBP_7380 [Paulownia witches'-broom phytoplasma]
MNKFNELSKIYDLESFKDNEIKKEIIIFFEKQNDQTYPKNLIIEYRSRIGVRSLCNSIMNKFNLSYNIILGGNINSSFFKSQYYNNNKNINIFFHEDKELIKNNFLEKILNREDFIIKPLYEQSKIISMQEKLNIFLCDF